MEIRSIRSANGETSGIDIEGHRSVVHKRGVHRRADRPDAHGPKVYGRNGDNWNIRHADDLRLLRAARCIVRDIQYRVADRSARRSPGGVGDAKITSAGASREGYRSCSRLSA